jgi:antitoxin MazE
MRVRVEQWGDSLAVRIPLSLAAEAALQIGSEVDVSVAAGRLVTSPVDVPAMRLDDLLVQITTDNLHTEIDTGSSIGREAW